MRFQCSLCQNILDIADCQPGDIVRCGNCQQLVQVPVELTDPGAILGELLIKEQIAEDAFGTLHLAHQLNLDRDVVMRVLSPQLAADEKTVEQFTTEAKAAASINSPNLVQTYAVQSHQGLTCVVMERINGASLEERLKNEPLSAPKAVELALGLATALASASKEKGLLHRDIQPSNILFAEDGTPKLSSLGLIPKSVEFTPDGEMELFISPIYMAPELMLGGQPSVQSDIYSLGATLYHALAGHPPYIADSPGEAAPMHITEPLIPLEEAQPTTPGPLAKLVDGMLAKRPRDRYADYDELLADINLAKEGKPLKHVIPPTAQQPVTGNDADDTQSARPKLKVAKGGGIKLASSGGGAPAPKRKATDAAPKKNTGAIVAIAVVAVLVVVGIVLAVVLAGGKKEPAQQAGPANPAEPGAGFNLAALTAKIEQGADAVELRKEIQEAQATIAPSTREAAELAAAVAPFVEQDLEKTRAEGLHALKSTWNQLSAAAKSKAAREQAEAERAAEEAAKAKEEKEAQAAEEARQKHQKAQFEANQKRIRKEIVEMANRYEFNTADNLFGAMVESEDEDAAAWSQGWINALEKAGKLYQAIRNSKDKYQGTEIPMLGSKQPWIVEEIIFDTINVSFTTIRTDKRSKREVKDVVNDTLNLRTLVPFQIFALAKAAADKGEIDQDSLMMYECCFLVLQGANLNLAKGFLEKHKEESEAAFLLAEIPLLSAGPYLERMVNKMRDLKKRQAQALAIFLKRNNADEYEEYKETAAGIIAELKE
ncbi:MAG: serine/threonine protein kinase [Victivallales bacterium]|nr:serine/threonine protein kinase [Victivallales bacterium]